jgi:hypothetical protein
MWYHAFIVCVFLLWLASTSRDRNALRIVLIASLVSEVVVELVTHQIHGAWKLAIPGALETLTILAMLHWARNRTGYLQASLLIVAWLAHLICYVDIIARTDWIYSRYEIIIQMVAVGQLAACYDTLIFHAGRLANSFRAGCVERLFPARTRASLLPSGRSARH